MAEGKDRNFIRGNVALAAGILLAVAGGLWAHFAGLPELDDVGRELYPHIPRGGQGWESALVGQLVSLGGVLLAMGGITLAYLYEKPMTWARASIGAGLFTALMLILLGVVPNEWLTYTQSVWNWTDQKIWLEIPQALVGGNELNISAAAVKDFIAGGYYVAVIVAVAVAMIRWQKRDEIRAAKEKTDSEKVSAFGRPLRKAGR